MTLLEGRKGNRANCTHAEGSASVVEADYAAGIDAIAPLPRHPYAYWVALSYEPFAARGCTTGRSDRSDRQEAVGELITALLEGRDTQIGIK